MRREGLSPWNSIANFCANPKSVIITLDADDALIGERVLDRVLEEYEDGAVATVGSMLRLDKEGHYPVRFDDPRRWDSNVWQHLRSFRKRLFDAIDVEDLKINGEWIEVATDWAFMVPIIEMASSPRHIPEVLHLYEPAAPKDDRGRWERDSVIGQILAKRLPKLTSDEQFALSLNSTEDWSLLNLNVLSPSLPLLGGGNPLAIIITVRLMLAEHTQACERPYSRFRSITLRIGPTPLAIFGWPYLRRFWTRTW